MSSSFKKYAKTAKKYATKAVKTVKGVVVKAEKVAEKTTHSLIHRMRKLKFEDGGMVDVSEDLSDFDIDTLDVFERTQYDRLTSKGESKESALQVIINTVEQDYSQLSEGLAAIARKQDGELYDAGGAIKNQYEGKTPEQVWDIWTESQRYEFVYDHHWILEEGDKEISPKVIKDLSKLSFKEALQYAKDNKVPNLMVALNNHIHGGEYAEGGTIPNNYEGKTPEQVWGEWRSPQRLHFLDDHIGSQSTPRGKEELVNKAYRFLPAYIKKALAKHIEHGQYEEGGAIDQEPQRNEQGVAFNYPEEDMSEEAIRKFDQEHADMSFMEGKNTLVTDHVTEEEPDDAMARMYNSDEWVNAQRNAEGLPDLGEEEETEEEPMPEHFEQAVIVPTKPEDLSEENFDKEIAMDNVLCIKDCAEKIEALVSDNMEFEAWVIAKMARVQVRVMDIEQALKVYMAHAKMETGGELVKSMCLSIAKNANTIADCIEKGVKLMSWMDNNIAVSAAYIKDVYSHLDYKLDSKEETVHVTMAEGGVLTQADWEAMSPHERDILQYSIKNYHFLLRKQGVYTYRELAEAIKNTYDISSGRNKAAYEYLMKFPESNIEVTHNTGYAKGGEITIGGYKVKSDKHDNYYTGEGVFDHAPEVHLINPSSFTYPTGTVEQSHDVSVDGAEWFGAKVEKKSGDNEPYFLTVYEKSLPLSQKIGFGFKTLPELKKAISEGLKGESYTVHGSKNKLRVSIPKGEYAAGGEITSSQVESLVGKKVVIYLEGQPNDPIHRTITKARLTPKQYTHIDLFLTLSDGDDYEYQINDNKIQAFLSGEEIVMGGKKKYSISLVDGKKGGDDEHTREDNPLKTMVNLEKGVYGKGTKEHAALMYYRENDPYKLTSHNHAISYNEKKDEFTVNHAILEHGGELTRGMQLPAGKLVTKFREPIYLIYFPVSTQKEVDKWVTKAIDSYMEAYTGEEHLFIYGQPADSHWMQRLSDEIAKTKKITEVNKALGITDKDVVITEALLESWEQPEDGEEFAEGGSILKKSLIGEKKHSEQSINSSNMSYNVFDYDNGKGYVVAAKFAGYPEKFVEKVYDTMEEAVEEAKARAKEFKEGGEVPAAKEFTPNKESKAFKAGSKAAKEGTSIDNSYPYTSGADWYNWLAGYWTVDKTKMPNMRLRNLNKKLTDGTSDAYLAEGGTVGVDEKYILDNFYGVNTFTPDQLELINKFDIQKMVTSSDTKAADFLAKLKSEGYKVKKKSYSDFTSIMGVKRKMADGGTVGITASEFAEKIKAAMKQPNKWHFIQENVEGKEVYIKFFVGVKEVDVQRYTINGIHQSMPKNYTGKRETTAMILKPWGIMEAGGVVHHWYKEGTNKYGLGHSDTYIIDNEDSCDVYVNTYNDKKGKWEYVKHTFDSMEEAKEYGEENEVYAKGGVTEGERMAIKGVEFLKSKGYEIDAFSEATRDAYFEVDDEVLQVVQGSKDAPKDTKIGITYFIENFEEPITKKMLRYIRKEFGKMPVTLYTNAGLELRHDEIKNGMWEGIKIVKVPLEEIQKMAEGGEVDSTAKVIVAGYPYWLTKIDSTHLFVSNEEGKKGSPWHVAQYKSHDDDTFYKDVEKWLDGKLDINGKSYKKFYKDGGKIGFVALEKKVARNYEGKPVPKKYQKDYGKKYSKSEALEVGAKVAATVKNRKANKKSSAALKYKK